MRPRQPVVRSPCCSGSGGHDVTADDVRLAQAATPDWRWHVLGADRSTWVADPSAVLAGADVVVTHAGQNALAETAAARRPAVVLPQRRPHDEQQTTGAVLADGWPAVVAARLARRRRVGRRARPGGRPRPAPLGRVVRRPGRRPVRRRGPGDPRAPRRRGRPMTRVAVVTIAHGRHEHLAAQHRSLARGTVRPDHYLAVAMDDPAIVEAAGRRAHPRGRRRRSRTRGRPAAGRRPQPRRPHRDRRRSRRGRAARRRLPGRRRPRGVVRRRGHGATGAHLVGPGDLPASPPAGRLPRRPGRPRGPGRPAPGATEPCARRAAGVRRPRPLLVAVLRRRTRARGSASAASARTTSATAGRTPTWVVRRSPAASGSAGSAAPAPTTSTTRSAALRSSTSTTSCATAGSSTSGGASGR